MKETELITNNDGSIFHLKLLPEDITDKIIIVGDPARVELIGSLLDSTDLQKSNREFHTIRGKFRNKKITVISSGIGTDNIDILLNELDALVNFDLQTKQSLKDKRSLEIVRIGTSGGLQGDLGPGEIVISSSAIGFDSVLNFYKDVETITDIEFEKSFREFTGWSERLPAPYIIEADRDLLDRFGSCGYTKGMTVSTPGFYAPQGRSISLEAWNNEINDKLSKFCYKGQRILNYEMESSAIYGLSKLLGHKSLTLCAAIGNRVNGKFVNDYQPIIRKLALEVLETI